MTTLERYEWPAALILAALAALLYLPALGNGYVFDDVVIVRQNPVVQELRYGEALAGPYWPVPEGAPVDSSNWRPLASVSFVLERQLLGSSSPVVAHAVNALLHGLLVAALFPVARRLAGRGWPALAACALFAVHPAHTEAVAPAVGRTDLLAALGGLLALECFLRYRDGAPGMKRWLLLGAAAYAAGLGAKESAAGVLLLLPAADWLLGGRRVRELFGPPALAYVPFLVVALVYVAARWAVLGGASFDHPGAVDYTLLQRLVFAAHNALVSVGLLLAPVRFHHMVTTLPENAPFTYPTPAGAAAVVTVLGGLFVAFGWIELARRAPRGAFLWLGALVTWLPTAGLLPAAAGASLRFLLLPTAFAACALALVLKHLAGARPGLGPALRVAVAIVVVLSAGLCLWRSTRWKDNGTFFSAVLAEEPDCYSAHYGLGNWYTNLRPPETARAREHYREAIRIAGRSPRSFSARLNLAVSYELGASGRRYEGPGTDLDEAARIYREIIEIDPDRWQPYLNLAVVLEHLGRGPEALEHYERALELRPQLEQAADIMLKCAELRERRGDREQAARHYRYFLERFTDHPERDVARRRLQRLTSGDQ